MPLGSPYERELKRILEGNGWVVIRSAGSLGSGDLVALTPNSHILIEVKSCKGNTFYTSRDNKEQFNALNKLAKEGINVNYAIRWKGKGKKEWEMFNLPMEPYPIFRKGEGIIYD